MQLHLQLYFRKNNVLGGALLVLPAPPSKQLTPLPLMSLCPGRQHLDNMPGPWRAQHGTQAGVNEPASRLTPFNNTGRHE